MISAKERLARVNEFALAKVEAAKESVAADGKPTVASLYLICIAGMWADTWGAQLDDKKVALSGLMAEYYSTGCRASRQARGMNIKDTEKAKQSK